MTAPAHPDTLIDRYFALAAGDRDAYLAQFADDAVVEDEGRTHHGAAAIGAWRGAVPAVTYRVLDVVPDGPGHRAIAEINGDFPGSPVELAFGFRFAGEEITRLTIRPTPAS